jgi:hypothetical protein
MVKQLNDRRNLKNLDFYNEHVKNEYQMLSKEQNTSVATLTASRKKAMIHQRSNTGLSNAEKEKAISKQVAINVNLAHKDPLKFIESILKHHNSY